MKYSESHEWVKVRGEIAEIGITDHAQGELGEVVFIELPRVGKRVEAGEEVAVIESTKAAADIHTPVSGEIIEINQELSEVPSRVNQNPESEGWLFKIRLTNLSEIDALLDKDRYLDLIG